MENIDGICKNQWRSNGSNEMTFGATKSDAIELKMRMRPDSGDSVHFSVAIKRSENGLANSALYFASILMNSVGNAPTDNSDHSGQFLMR